jgi:hypothetical protein
MHEYVHALQDQHFDLLKLLAARPYNFDRAEAAFSVVEGDAMNVQRRREQTDAVWSRRALEEIGRGEDARFADYRREVGAFFPPLLTETFIFRYRDGTRFVETVRRKSGARGVDELFRRPPASSEQVLHPEKYFAQEQPREVTLDEQLFAANNWDSRGHDAARRTRRARPAFEVAPGGGSGARGGGLGRRPRLLIRARRERPAVRLEDALGQAGRGGRVLSRLQLTARQNRRTARRRA